MCAPFLPVCTHVPSGITVVCEQNGTHPRPVTEMFKTFRNEVAPKIQKDPALASKVQVIFRQQVQPWHPTSTLVHEAALAVMKLAPHRFWDFSAALFDMQKVYFDVSIVNETRNAVYERLAKLGADSCPGAFTAYEMYKLLAIPEEATDDGSLNVGNQVTDDLKVVIKDGTARWCTCQPDCYLRRRCE